MKVALFVTSAVVVTALAGCEADSGGGHGGSADAGATPGPTVIAPGRPGEAAETLSAREAEKRKPDDRPNSADRAYARTMIAHHEQAVEMTGLAPERARSTGVRRLAERIAAAQRPEIGTMRAWLENNGGARARSGHQHAAMPGMATEAQLKALGKAKGRAFDELFLKLMITHHQGAVTMATDVLSEGNDVVIEEMATDVIAQQTSEVDRMRDMD